MQQSKKEVNLSGLFVAGSVLLNAIVLKQGFIEDSGWYALLPITILLPVASLVLFKRWHQ